MNNLLAKEVETNLDVDGKFYCLIEIELNSNKFAFYGMVQHLHNAKTLKSHVEKSQKIFGEDRICNIVPFNEFVDYNPDFFNWIYNRQKTGGTT